MFDYVGDSVKKPKKPTIGALREQYHEIAGKLPPETLDHIMARISPVRRVRLNQFIRGNSLSDIARSGGCSSTSVKSTIIRAIGNLKYLAEEEQRLCSQGLATPLSELRLTQRALKAFEKLGHLVVGDLTPQILSIVRAFGLIDETKVKMISEVLTKNGRNEFEVLTKDPSRNLF